MSMISIRRIHPSLPSYLVFCTVNTHTGPVYHLVWKDLSRSYMARLSHPMLVRPGLKRISILERCYIASMVRYHVRWLRKDGFGGMNYSPHSGWDSSRNWITRASIKRSPNGYSMFLVIAHHPWQISRLSMKSDLRWARNHRWVREPSWYITPPTENLHKVLDRTRFLAMGSMRVVLLPVA